MLLIVVLLIGIVPPLPRILRSTPWKKSSPARVTTNDGSPIWVMISPWISPIKAHTASAAPIAAHHGHPCAGDAMSAITAAPVAAT